MIAWKTSNPAIVDLAAPSFGMVKGGVLRKLTGAEQAVDQCSGEYLGGRMTGTAATLLAYAGGAVPATLTHFTTKTGAAGIAATGTINAGAWYFDRGVYAAAIRTRFVPAPSTVPLAVSGQGFIRIVPGAVFLSGGGTPLPPAWFGLYGGAANWGIAGGGC